MSDDRRNHPRTNFKCRVKIWHDSFGTRIVNTRDVSDSGLFLITDTDGLPSMGTIVEGQIQGLPMEAPIVKMEIVRMEPTGIGLRFIEE